MTYSVPMEREPVKAYVNPVSQLRIKNKWSLEECAVEIGVSPSTIIRTEQGLYNDIPPRIFRYLSDRTLSPGTVTYDYHRWQNSRRMQTLNGKDVSPFIFFKQSLSSLIQQEPETNPILLWRFYVLGYESRLAFCRDLCLHPSTIKRYEDGVAERMPESLISALELSRIEIDWEFLDECYRKWRRTRSNAA